MEAGVQFRLEEVTAKQTPWTLTLLEGRLRLERADGGEVHEIDRSDYGRGFEVHDIPGAPRVLTARLPKRRSFRLDPDTLAAVDRWLRPFTRTDVASILRTRLKWTLPIAILFLATSLPLPGVPEEGIEPVPFDGVGFALGAGLLVLGVLSRVAPHRNLFLLDAVWFLLLAGDTVWSVVGQGRSPLWLLLAAFLVWVAMTPLALYRRFAETD